MPTFVVTHTGNRDICYSCRDIIEQIVIFEGLVVTS